MIVREKISKWLILLKMTLVLGTCSTRIVAYVPCSSSSSLCRASRTSDAAFSRYGRSNTKCFMSSSEEDESNNKKGIGGLFQNMFGRDNTDKTSSSSESSIGPKILIDLKCNEIKVGGLRLAMALHCMGLQNTPTQGSWKANQSNDGILDLFYQDGTASIAINFDEDFGGRIWIERWGSGTDVKPSLQYMLQESLILHNLLDEIEKLAFDNTDEVDDEQRLLVLKNGKNDIDAARSTLPARQA